MDNNSQDEMDNQSNHEEEQEDDLELSQNGSQMSQTHDSRVVKTVRSLIQERRPESAQQRSKILQSSTNVQQPIMIMQSRTLLQSQKDISHSDSHFQDHVSPIKTPIILAQTGGKQYSQKENMTGSQATNGMNESFHVPNSKAGQRNLSNNQRDINIRKSVHRQGTTPNKMKATQIRNQSSNNLPRKTQTNKKENNQAPPPQLTKEIEDNLLETTKEKVIECVKTSNEIHDLLEQNQIDKMEIIHVLYSDKLFTYQLAQLLFKMKMIVKKRLEEFLISKIQKVIYARNTDEKLMQRLNNLQSKLYNRLSKLHSMIQ